MRARLGLIAAVALSSVLSWGAPASASPPQPTNLHVVGGSDTWHADNHFELQWTNPPSGGSPLVTTHYRVRSPQGNEIKAGEIAWLSDGVAALTLPKVPGSYSAEIWLEDAAGVQGPAATTPLRFDNTRPEATTPGAVTGWIGRTSFPLHIHLGHPLGPLPISGIRGYAVAIDGEPTSSPCVAADRCTDAETTLRGGITGDTVEIAELREGTHYLHAVAVSGSGMKSATSGHTLLRVDNTDPVTQLVGAPNGWTDRALRLSANATDAGSGMTPIGSREAFTAIQVDGGPPTISAGSSVTTSVIDEGAHRIAYYARDAAGNTNEGAAGSASHRPNMAWVRIDRTPPRASFANSQDPADPDLIRVRIADSLSGPDSARGRISLRRAGSGDRFETLAPLTAQVGELRARWNSDTYPAGEYEFRAIAYDLAGNSVTATRRQNGEPMVLSNPLKTPTTLRTAFHQRGLERTVPFGRRVLLSGRLIAGRDTALPGMPLRVIERFAPGTHVAPVVTTAVTGPGGSFSVRTGPGPSRTIEVAFEGSPTLSRARGSSLDLRVRSRVRLSASAAVARVGGAPLIFKGRLLTQPGTTSANGRAVQLQFRLPGLPWSEFRTVQTDARGRFRYAYRFSDDDSRGARFQFRAYAPAQEDWPYEPAGSRPILVRGR